MTSRCSLCKTKKVIGNIAGTDTYICTDCVIARIRKIQGNDIPFMLQSVKGTLRGLFKF